MPGAVFLEGEKVELRTIEEGDIEFIRDNFNHPEVRRGLSYWRPQNLEQEREWFEEMWKSDDIHLAICEEGEMRGVISLKDRDEKQVKEMGIWIGKDHQGKGLGTAASRILVKYGFNQLNVHKVMARAMENNEASRNLWRKLGFKEEGQIRELVYRDGSFEDVFWYGITKGEWTDE